MGDGVPGVVGGCGACWTRVACGRASGWSVARRVKNFGHVLVVVGAIWVLTEGSVGVFVFKGLGLWLPFVPTMLVVG